MAGAITSLRDRAQHAGRAQGHQVHAGVGRRRGRHASLALAASTACSTGRRTSGEHRRRTSAAIPSYYLNRYWAWGKQGSRHLLKEVAPFWALTFVGMAFSTWTVDFAESFAVDRYDSRLIQTMFVERRLDRGVRRAVGRQVHDLQQGAVQGRPEELEDCPCSTVAPACPPSRWTHGCSPSHGRQGVHARRRGRRAARGRSRAAQSRARPAARDRLVLRQVGRVSGARGARRRHGALFGRPPPRLGGEPGRVGATTTPRSSIPRRVAWTRCRSSGAPSPRRSSRTPSSRSSATRRGRASVAHPVGAAFHRRRPRRRAGVGGLPGLDAPHRCGGWLAIHDVFPDPADGGRPPYELYRHALDNDCYIEVAAHRQPPRARKTVR